MTRLPGIAAIAIGLLLVGTATAVAGERPVRPADERQVGGLTAAPAPSVQPEEVTIEVNLRADGSAHWTVEHRVALDDAATRRGFNRTQRRLRENRSAFRAPFARRIHGMATDAQEQTGRTMIVENVSVEAYRTGVPREYGVVAYEFRWYGFAETGERLRAGDAMSQLFLEENTTLLITAPADTTVATVTPPPDRQRDGTLVWTGPYEFARDEPRVVVGSGSFGSQPLPAIGSNDVLLTVLTFGLVVVGTTGVGVGVWRRRSGDEESTAGDARGGATRDEPAGGPESEGDRELLSNEEQVLALLEDRGGRMKQQTVVTELDWSETKTSEVVSTLRESGDVDVYRLGRENVLTLPDTGIETGGDET